MRLQLTPRAWLSAVLVLAAVAPARADGSLELRTVYYKERSTRVIQPMLDGMFDAGAHGLIVAHFLVDAITSASVGSGAANATPFTEKRYEAGAGYTRELQPLRLKADGKYSTEPDYQSLYGGIGAEIDLNEKNTVLGVTGGYSHDEVESASAQGPYVPPYPCLAAGDHCNVHTTSGFASVSQILSRNLVVGGSYDIAKIDGFQQNAYRLVLTSTTFVPERHPDDRTRQSFAVSARYYLPASQTTFIAAYRYYRDDWHIHAHTPELRIVQEVGRFADATFGYRYYRQNAAFFYEERYPSPIAADNKFPTCGGLTKDGTPCFSDDPKMSAFDGHTLTAKLGVLGEEFDLGGMWAGARFEGILEYIVQHNRFGNAVVANVALTLPFDY